MLSISLVAPMQLPKPSKNIAALWLVANSEGNPRHRGIFELPRDAEVDVCGAGFNGRTVKLRWRGEFFTAFVQDLESPIMGGFVE